MFPLFPWCDRFLVWIVCCFWELSDVSSISVMWSWSDVSSDRVLIGRRVMCSLVDCRAVSLLILR
jgi:hypothetical protein